VDLVFLTYQHRPEDNQVSNIFWDLINVLAVRSSRTCKRVLAEVASKVLQVVLDLFLGIGNRHGHHLARNDGLLTLTTYEAQMVVVILLAERISVLGRVKLSRESLLANRADKVVWMVGFVECVHGRTFYGLLTMSAGRTEGCLPMLRAVSVAVYSLADSTIFELALAHLAQ
jgi:hypothetical protein